MQKLVFSEELDMTIVMDSLYENGFDMEEYEELEEIFGLYEVDEDELPW